jgi:hypothetical protein
MKEIGKMMSDMEEDMKDMKIKMFILVTSIRAKHMAKGSILGEQLEKSMTVSGLEALGKEKEYGRV